MQITREDLEQTFGGSDSRSRGYYSAVYASSANAYMLMYRRINKKDNGRKLAPPHPSLSLSLSLSLSEFTDFLLSEFTLKEALPKHILRQIEEEREAERKEQERQEWERNLCKVGVAYGRGL